MKNEMSFVYHTIEWLGCNCISEDNENLNEIIQGHPMKKQIKPKLMQVG